MHKFLIALIIVSTHSSADVLKPACTDKMLYEHSIRLQAEIFAHARYPRGAINDGLEGFGTIYFEYSNKDVVPKNIRIVKSTNYESLDYAMIRAIKEAKLPVSLCDIGDKNFDITVPFDFKLPTPKSKKESNLTAPTSPLPLHK